MERPTAMRNRLVALSAVLAFAVGVAAVAAVAGSGGDGENRLEKLSFAFAGGGGAERDSMALGAPDMAYPQFGPLEYKVRGELPALGGEAPAYRLADETSKAKVAELASHLGLPGDVEASANGWTVRDGERELSVLRVPGVPWYLSPVCAGTPPMPDAPASSTSSEEGVISSGCAYGAQTMSGGAQEPSSMPPPAVAVARAPATVAVATCRQGSMDCRPATEAPTTTAMPPCRPGASCAYGESKSLAETIPPDHRPSPPAPAPPPAVRPADLPSEAEAERIARSFFADRGVAVERFELHDGFSQWFATVQPRVGGLNTVGWVHSVAVGPKGEIVTGNGYLSEPERIGDYPLAGTATGLERLRSGMGGGWSAFEGGVDRGSETVSADCGKPDVACDQPVPVTTVPESERPFTTSGSCPVGTECLDAPASPPQLAPADPAAPAVPPSPPVIIITGVHLALQYATATLVPVYVFELEGGGEAFPVPAVTDEWIAAHVEEDQGVPEGQPRPMPMPAPIPIPAPTSAPAPVRVPAPPPTSAPAPVEGEPSPVR